MLIENGDVSHQESGCDRSVMDSLTSFLQGVDYQAKPMTAVKKREAKIYLMSTSHGIMYQPVPGVSIPPPPATTGHLTKLFAQGAGID